MFYHDHTEATPTSLLPQSYISASRQLTHLEHLTGADLLISPYPEPLPSILQDIPPHIIPLRRHCQHGVLVQRKTGHDLLSSIDHLDAILCRMLEWSPSPWLLVTNVKPTRTGGISITGTKSRRRSRWNWASVSAALDAWQDRGGCVKLLPGVDDIVPWCESRQRACTKWLDEPTKEIHNDRRKKPPRASKRIPKARRQEMEAKRDNWVYTCAAWPKGVSVNMLRSLAVYIEQIQSAPPTLANAIALACSDEVLKVKGWGKTTLTKVRDWYGVNTSLGETLGSPSGCFIIYDNERK